MFSFFLILLIVFIGLSPYMVISSYLTIYVYQFFAYLFYIKFPRFFEGVLITHANHRNHHDQNYYYQDSNFGIIFSVWDRIFGIYSNSINDNEFLPKIKGYEQYNFLKIKTDPLMKYFKNKNRTKNLDS